MAHLLRDLRFALRVLRKTPLLSLIAVVTFALGIGLTTTVFSIVNGAIFKGLPFEDGDRIVSIFRNNPSLGQQNIGVTVHDFLDWREQQTTIEDLAAVDGRTINLVVSDGRPERFTGGFVSANLFDVLGVRPVLGRGFRPGEDKPGADPVIVIGYGIWQRLYAGSPDVIGKTVKANGETRTIIGVAPEGFEFPANEELWAPLQLDRGATERGQGPRFLAFGRLRDGVSADRAGADFATIAARLEARYPESNRGVGATVEPYTRRFIGDDVYAMLFTMLGAVLGVLLIGCANVANLLFARASTRTKELAIRTALGASRRRVILQLMYEVLILAGVGSLLGIAIGYGGVEWFKAALAANPPPFWITFGMDWRVLLFVLSATLFAALFSGFMPALRASESRVTEALKEEGRGTSSHRIGKFSAGLVVAEVALSCGLLVVSGLMVKSVVKLGTVDLPFATENIFTARLSLPIAEYPDTAGRVRFYEQLLERLRPIPGVEAATLSDGLPASGNGSRVFEVEGASYPTDRDYPFAREGIVTPGYFDTFQAKVLEGRGFSPMDRMTSLRVAVVNRTFAHRFFPGPGSALGRRIRMGRGDTTAMWLTVIGVVPDLRMEGIGNDGSPAGFYIPIAQSGVGNFVSIALRTGTAPLAKSAAVRAAVQSIDPNLPIYNVMEMRGVIKNATWFYGVFGTLFMVFGAVALFLAAVGLYGVMSFAVTSRSREMGVRIALGATGGRLIGLVMRRGVIQLSIGLVIGLVLALLASGPLQIVLFEVEARDPWVFGVVAAVLAVTGLAASFIPARRVTRIEPMAVLTTE